MSGHFSTLCNKGLKKKIYTNELLNLSVETMNSIVEDTIDLLQDKSNLSLPYRSVFVISSSCFFKSFHQFSYYSLRGII